ncbi:MAG: hypothetical protein Q8M22_05485 [Actinomycetota bacterium]|nr:hypothetical protein [Actinomycetota bacterium]
MFFRRVFSLLALVAVGAACGQAGSTNDSVVPDTVPIGELPPSLAPSSVEAETTVVRTTVPLTPDEQIGALVGGNRVIVIGDSVMASTAKRYSGDMCAALVPLGWQVELDAETGRFIEFGHEVLDARLSAGWDASVILLGNNYRDDQARYRDELERMVQRLSPNPVVLLTVSEFTPSRAQVNQVIFDLAEIYANVLIVDWGATTAADPTLTGGDGLHLSTEGRAALAQQVALALGTAPSPDGQCLTTSYDDDSTGPVDGTTTTVRRNNRPTTSQGQPASTNPPATDPPPPVTDPPATDPPTS